MTEAECSPKPDLSIEEMSNILTAIFDDIESTDRVRLMRAFNDEQPDYLIFNDTDYIGVHLTEATNKMFNLCPTFQTDNGWSVGKRKSS